jgi:hypothetical protein
MWCISIKPTLQNKNLSTLCKHNKNFKSTKLIILKQGCETMCYKIKLNHEEKEWKNKNEKLH